MRHSTATHPYYFYPRVGPVLAIGIAVECWIGVTNESGRRTVRVAGRLKIAHVPELLTACAGSAMLILDLSDLISADMAGIEALRRMRTNGAILVGTPGYIHLKIADKVSE